MSRNFAVMKHSHTAARTLLGCFLASTALCTPVSAQSEKKAENTTVLDQIVVTASGFEQNVKDAPASITVVTSEELAKGSYRDLTDALREVQGVAVTGVANERDIFIRGLPGSYTLLLVDGKRQNTRESRTNGNSGFEQSFLPPVAAIDRIEIVRGPMSSLYGSDAMGGVINVITKKVGDKWSGSITTEGTVQQHSGSGNSGQASWYANGPILKDMLGLQLWGRGFKRGEDSILGGDHASREYDFNGKLTFTPNEDHDFFLEGGKTRLRRDTTAGKTTALLNNNGRRNSDSSRVYSRDHWSLSHNGRWTDTTSTEMSIQQEWGERDTIGTARTPVIRNTVVDAKLNTQLELLGTHKVTIGGQFNQADLTDHNPGVAAVNEQFSVSQWALFMEDEWSLTETFALTGGLRFDQHEIYGEHVTPRLYGVWRPTDEWTIKGGVSRGFKAPEIRNVAPGYATTTGGGSCLKISEITNWARQSPCGVILAEPTLSPETSTSYELSALWDNGTVNLGATYFYTEFKDKISNARKTGSFNGYERWTVNPDYVVWELFNIDDAVIQGIELTGTWYLNSDITVRGSYTYTDSEQQTGQYAGFPLARTPKHMANLRADWITPIEGLEAWSSVNYHGEEINAGARVGSNGTPVRINGQTGRKYDGYATLDIGANYALNDNLDFKAAVYNVLNKEVSTEDNNTVGEGRRFWVSMTAKF